MKIWTVVGYYDDPAGDWWADWFLASSAESAGREALDGRPSATVLWAVQGQHVVHRAYR